MTHKIISPIAIDMGAKHTGVYYARYEAGSRIEDINKKGEVLTYGDYTALLKNRTAQRHARRGHQRNKLTKRLLVLILKEYFHFPANEHLQAIGFLLNRRGFSYFEGDYSEDTLQNFPKEAWEKLPEKARQILKDDQADINTLPEDFDLAKNLKGLIDEAPDKVEETYKVLLGEGSEYKKLKWDWVYFAYIKKMKESCQEITNSKKIEEKENDRNKLSRTPNWIIDRLGINCLTANESGTGSTDLLVKLNSDEGKKLAQDLTGQLPDITSDNKAAKESCWNFNTTKFEPNDKNTSSLDDIQDKDHIKNHLHYFCYAIHKTNHEIKSGSRHRTKYFKEIRDDLEGLLQKEGQHQYLSDFGRQIEQSTNLDINKLHKLVCHISNLELKPLRKYFNDNTPDNKKNKTFISHKKQNGGDTFSLEKLSRIASIWFTKNWRISLGKDNQKKVDDYKKLKEAWENHNQKNDIIEFWLHTDPVLTIPPYTSMTNRHPPRCQSLLLNKTYLAKHYPEWCRWLELMQPDKDYEKKLAGLKSNQQKQLVNDEDIKLRQLQFILDTTKKMDEYRLNEIWSCYHKLQQLERENHATNDMGEWHEKLEAVKKKSKLPEALKQGLELNDESQFMEKSFGHFINKYYQTRRKARDGRYFLIQQKKNDWLTEGKLLTLCPHRPRQKKHQYSIDLAGVLGIDREELINITGNDIENWLGNIKGLKTACNNATEAQKKHRGYLKTRINTDKKLGKLDKRCKEIAGELAQKLYPNLATDQQQAKADRFSSIFSFAQMNNIVFKERSGFSSTCPVCSTDNGFRMRANDKNIAQASRLSAMSIRLIDGVVMRICEAKSQHIASTCYEYIKEELEKNNKVSIPLILEQNRFEFEPSLKEIKTNKKSDKQTDPGEKDYADKENRIKQAAQDISAYSGNPTGENGELDHIIPRGSKYGTLNDEANLIYVSRDDNQQKGNQWKGLSDLHINYRKQIFGNGNTDDRQIRDFIYTQLERSPDAGINDDAPFAFGPYLNFTNLDSKQQKAFRHALFLNDGDPLRQKVIHALQNRNRAIVNGTQRYMAQCIADRIYKLARRDHREKQIEFDYFEYSARANVARSIYELRTDYANYVPDIKKQSRQPLHSHLIDAQMAFLLAVEEHAQPGSMGIAMNEGDYITGTKIDEETGEILPGRFFDSTFIKESESKSEPLNAKSSNRKIIDIENSPQKAKKQNLSKIFTRFISTQNAIGERYKPICKDQSTGKLYLGYPQKGKGGQYTFDSYCEEVGKKVNKDKDTVKAIIDNGKYYELTIDNQHIQIYTIRKIDRYKQIDKDSHRYFSRLSPEYSEAEKNDVKHIQWILSKCRYYVKKTEVINAPNILNDQKTKNIPFIKAGKTLMTHGKRKPGYNTNQKRKR